MRRRKLLALVVGMLATTGLGLMVATSTLADASQVGSREASAAVAVSESVGGFAVRMATALQLPGPRGGFTAETAAAALWQVDVKVQLALSKPLTEADVTNALSQIGFALRTDEPDRFVSSSRADTIVSTFVNSAAVAERLRMRRISVSVSGNGGDDFNNGNGRGGKFKRKNSPSGTAADDNW
jgi:hypothetical protein